MARLFRRNAESRLAGTLVVAVARLHDDVGDDAKPAVAVEVTAPGQCEKVRDRRGCPLGIQPHHNLAFRRADRDPRMRAR